jgi:hypothetical protein
MREFEQDVRARDAAKAVYDLTVAESKSEGLRGGDVAVANSSNLNRLKYSENVQQSAQEFALDKGGSFGVGSSGGYVAGPGFRDPAAAAGLPSTATPTLKPASPEAKDALSLGTTANGSLAIRGGHFATSLAAAGEPGEKAQHGYRASFNYAQQARVVRGRAFYQNGNTWTDATAQERLAKDKNLKQRQVKFNSDEYFALLAKYPDAAAWFSLGNEVDVMLGDELVMVR